MSRFRNFVFTSFRLLNEDERKVLFENRNIRFIVYQHELCPTTSREHLQGYCELYEQRNASSLRELFLADDNPDGPSYLHLDTRRGTQAQAIEYCIKETTRVHGPYRHGNPGQPGKRNDLIGIKRKLDSGETYASVLETDFEIVARAPRFFREYSVMARNKPRTKKSRVIYCYGPTCTGKSEYVMGKGAAFVNFANGFLNGYDHQPIVCFDDVDDKTFTRQTWNALMGSTPYPVNCKNESNFQWNPETIYITSQLTLNELCKGDAGMISRVDEQISFMTSVDAGRQRLQDLILNRAPGI